MQVLNDGADEEDFKQLLEILKGFGEVEVLYDPNDPKDKDVTGDEVAVCELCNSSSMGRYFAYRNKACNSCSKGR